MGRLYGEQAGAMAFTPTSVSATLAPSAPPPPAATKGTPRRAPWNAAPLAAALASSTAALLAATPAAHAAAFSKEDVAGSFTKVRAQTPMRRLLLELRIVFIPWHCV